MSNVKFLSVPFLLLAGIALPGCQGNDRLQEKAGIESEVASRNQIKAEKEWAREREEDLRVRYRFVSALNGVYEGVLKGKTSDYRVRVKIKPTLPPPPKSNHTRTLAEIEFDLNNLFVNAQIVQWSDDNLIAFGCVFNNVRPDMNLGTLEFSSPNCNSTFSLVLTESEYSGLEGGEFEKQPDDLSKGLANSALKGDLIQFDAIRGVKQPNKNSQEFEFFVKRVLP